MRAVVVGSTNVDIVLPVASLPRAGETVLATGGRREPGGKGGNQAVALARLGAQVSFVSAVGDDDAGRWSLEQLSAEGVDVSLVRVVPAPTGTAVVVVGSDAENLIVVDPGANSHVHPPPGMAADVLLVSLEIPMQTAIEAARAAACPVVLNAAPAAVLPGELLSVVDVLVVNEHELALLGTAEQLRARGPRLVIETRGGEGCRVTDAEGIRHWQAAPAEVVDTTGAGDCFSAAIAFGIGSGWTTDRTVRLALGAAARSVGQPGARAGLPRMAELEAE